MYYRNSALRLLERSLSDTGLQVSRNEKIRTSNKELRIDILVQPESPLIDVLKQPQLSSEDQRRVKIFGILERPYFPFTVDEVVNRLSDVTEYIRDAWVRIVGVKKAAMLLRDEFNLLQHKPTSNGHPSYHGMNYDYFRFLKPFSLPPNSPAHNYDRAGKEIQEMVDNIEITPWTEKNS